MFNLYRTQNAWQMLHTEGNKVLNEKGEKVRLLGVNCAPLVWLSYSEKIMDMITYACDEWKANTIRLPLAQDRWFGFASEQLQSLGRVYQRRLIRYEQYGVLEGCCSTL